MTRIHKWFLLISFKVNIWLYNLSSSLTKMLKHYYGAYKKKWLRTFDDDEPYHSASHNKQIVQCHLMIYGVRDDVLAKVK